MVEIGSIIILGIFAQWIAWRFKVPAILPLILTGLAVGPFSSLFLEGGEKWLNPIYNGEKGLFPGEKLFQFVELAIGIILFEGGLTLKRDEIKDVGSSILNLITIGSTITFVGGTLIVHFILDLSWAISALFAALIIVTGPTVIAPILRNLPLKKNVSSVLKWEGILIDPIGALAAVFVYEFIHLQIIGGDGHFTQHALIQFVQVALIGSALGFLAAYTLTQFLKRELVPHYLLNVFTLAYVIGVFVLSMTIVPDSGLLTVVVMGLLMANMDVPHIKEILYFKESISVLLISILFILLSANINIADLKLLLDVKILMVFLCVILLLRPLGVFISTHKSKLTIKEKIFISWVGPRGIVAAGIASLFGLKLTHQGYAGAEYITPLVFMIVLGTVLLNATTAGLLAKMLGVLIEKSSGILIIGANRAAILLAEYLNKNGKQVALVDSNPENIKRAKKQGLVAYEANIYNDDIRDNLELSEMGFLMALTGSSNVNAYAIRNFKSAFGENGAYRLINSDELENNQNNPEEGLFSHTDDYINFNEVARDYPHFYEIELENKESYLNKLQTINDTRDCIPLFVKNKENNLTIIPSHANQLEIQEGDLLVYMGKSIASFKTLEENLEAES